jgi:hypothetical protein
MRLLNITQTYFPFMEFGGPPVKGSGFVAGADSGAVITDTAPAEETR